jgi:hypothetical protein
MTERSAGVRMQHKYGLAVRDELVRRTLRYGVGAAGTEGALLIRRSAFCLTEAFTRAGAAKTNGPVEKRIASSKLIVATAMLPRVSTGGSARGENHWPPWTPGARGHGLRHAPLPQMSARMTVRYPASAGPSRVWRHVRRTTLHRPLSASHGPPWFGTQARAVATR